MLSPTDIREVPVQFDPREDWEGQVDDQGHDAAAVGKDTAWVRPHVVELCHREQKHAHVGQKYDIADVVPSEPQKSLIHEPL